jgi:hypothetical protein
MSVNTNSPFGFRRVGVVPGVAPTFGLSKYRIDHAYNTAIFTGDPVMWVVSSATGYIKVGAPAVGAATPLVGIFCGCEYVSVSQKRKVWSNYYPGSGDVNQTLDVTAWVSDDPNAIYRVMGNSTNFNATSAVDFTSSVVGQYCSWVQGTGNTATGLSTAYVTTPTTSGATCAFRVVDLITDPPGSIGSDVTSAYNHVLVSLVNAVYRDNGGTTGIS